MEDIVESPDQRSLSPGNWERPWIRTENPIVYKTKKVMVYLRNTQNVGKTDPIVFINIRNVNSTGVMFFIIKKYNY